MNHDWEALNSRVIRVFSIFLFGSALLSFYQWSPFPFLFCVLAVLLAIPPSISVILSRFDPFEPIIFYTAFTGMTGIVIFERRYLSRTNWLFDVIPYSLDTGLLIVLVVYIFLMASVLLGYYGSEYLSDFSIFTNIAPTTRQTNSDFLRAIGYIYIFLGLFSFLMIIITTLDGNPFAMYTSTRPRSETFATSTHWMILTNGLPLGYLLCLSAAVIDIRRLPFRWLAFGPVVVGMFVITGSRGRVVVAALLLVAFCFYCVRFRLLRHDTLLMKISVQISRIGWALIGVLGVLAVSIGVTVAKGARMASSPLEVAQNLEITTIATAGVNDYGIDNFLALTQLIPSGEEYYYGSFYLRVILNFIPRAIWEEKPVLTLGSLLRRQFLPDASGGRPPGEIGAYYANFGYPGILLMGGIFGVLMRSLYELLKRNRKSPLAIIFFIITVLTVGRNGLANNPLFTFLSWIVFLLPVLVGHTLFENSMLVKRLRTVK